MQEQHDFAIPWPVGDGEASPETSNSKKWVIEACHPQDNAKLH
jgi:hypothetical protein